MGGGPKAKQMSKVFHGRKAVEFGSGKKIGDAGENKNEKHPGSLRN